MADQIKGLTIKIGADTTDFIKGLKSADKQINNTQKEANALQKSLQLDFSESRFIQAQKSAQKALSETEQKAESIRKQLKYLEDTGGVDTDGYAKLQTELAKTETKALTLKKQLDDLDKIKLENATKGITDFGNKAESAGKKLSAVSLAAAGILVGAAKLSKDVIKVGDDVNTMASQFDLSTKAIQEWQYIALQGDVSAEKLFKSANKIRDAFGSQLQGEVNSSTKVLENLGIKISDFGSQEDAFQGTILALSKVEDKTLQYKYAVDLFGEKVATDIIPLLDAGAGSIEQWANEFEQIGYLSEEQVKSLAKFDEAMNKVNTQLSQAKNELGIALLPVMEIAVDLLENFVVPAVKNLANWFSNLNPIVQKVIIVGLALIAMLSPLLIIVGKVALGISALIPVLVKLKLASASAALGVGALVGGLSLGLDLISGWGKMSAIEKILKSLALAALTAAAAVAVFHSTWSVGLAVGAIAAGITAAVGAINSAREKILPDSDDISVDNIYKESGVTSSKDLSNYNVPSNNTNNYGNNVVNDNSTTSVNITLTPTGDLNYDIKELADAVIKKIVVAKQSSGR